MTPLFSICVPSRNRQKYFKQTIEAMLKSPHPNVEFVFADNSDDPSIMNDFMAPILARDSRVVYLPSTGETLSMIDNWERTMHASTGDWISFVGDDDFVDPDFALLLPKMLAVNPELEAITWTVIGYTWPWEGRKASWTYVPLDHFAIKVEQAEAYRRMFMWYGAKHVPTSGFSVYHSAVSRVLMERIRAKFGNRYFEHPVVDYDNAFKVITQGRHLAMVNRPFSVNGSCPESNSFGVGKFEIFKKRTETFIEEAKHNFEADKEVLDFPFKSLLGTTATIAQAQHWFKNRYNLNCEGWEANFAKACEQDVELCMEREAFDLARRGYEAAFRIWKNGKFLKDFNPTFRGAHIDERYLLTSGFSDSGVYVDQEIAGVTTAGGMFEIARAFLTPAADVPVDKDGLKFMREFFQDRKGPEQLKVA